MNRLTVLMSVYNDSKYLPQAVSSILNQSFKEFEFLIIDDGSEENIRDVLSGFSDSRIVYKRIEHKGLAAALNFGLNNSSGDLIARIDADDICTPERLEVQMDFIAKNSGIDVVGGRSVYFKDKMKILFELKPPVDNDSIVRYLNLHNPINHSAVMFRKEKIMENGGYDESYNCYEDFELWLRLKSKLKFATIPEVLVFTRLRYDSMTAVGSRLKIRNVLYRNAENNLGKSKSNDEKKFWHNILFRIEYFYGNKDRARVHLPQAMAFGNIAAYITTFLPQTIFYRLISSRFRYRLQLKPEDKKKFVKQLETILTRL